MTETYNVYGKKSYEYALGRISGAPHRILTAEQWARLREADYATAEKLLTDLGFTAEGGVQTRIEAQKDLITAFVREIAPDEELTNLLFFEEDALNLKMLIKAAKIGKELSLDTLREGGFDKELLAICVRAEDFSMLGSFLDEALSAVLKEDDPCRISCLVDNAMFSYALMTAKRKKSQALATFLIAYGEGKNRLTALRLQKLGKDKDLYSFAFLPVSVASIENADEASILEETARKLESVLTDLSYDDGFGAIAHYYFRKKQEAAALRLLFAEKMSQENTKEASV